MLDNTNLAEPFDVKGLEDEVSALIDRRGTEPVASPIRRTFLGANRMRIGSEPADHAEVVEPAGAEDSSATPRSIEDILLERGKTHGDFTDNARVMQALKRIVHAEVGWDRLTDVQREALHMILHKVGRIISGNPNVKDHWDDIAGYAKLTSERIVE